MFETAEIQQRIMRWVVRAFGTTAMPPKERALRVLEEATELAQALGVDCAQAQRVHDVVYSKPVGGPLQELGGAATTLLACAQSLHVNLSEIVERELARVESLPIERFRKRQELNVELGIGLPRDFCAACERGEETIVPPNSSIVGSMPVHRPSGNVCQKAFAKYMDDR